MIKNIIHITHTDPFEDSRILNLAESIEDLDTNNRQYIISLKKKIASKNSNLKK